MKFLNRLLKTKKLDNKTIGSMWLCAANFNVSNFTKPNWCDVLVKEVGIKEAYMRQDGMFVESTERNQSNLGATIINLGATISFRGYVGRLAWNEENKNYFVGFFETKEEAKNAYLDLVEKLIKDLASKIQKI